jgi:tripeptidyl-peptidase-1
LRILKRLSLASHNALTAHPHSPGNLKVFHPDFPASLPAVTAVGATQLNLNKSETTVTSFSGGGFTYSKYFPRNTSCTYQAQAASTFFSTSKKLPPSNMYDSNGCGYPDVSALGVNFEVRWRHTKFGGSADSHFLSLPSRLFSMA